MSGERGAGRSADDWSRKLRQEAEQLQARADRIDQGARGERRTAEVLNPRSGDGWYVLHDLAVPDSNANIDHVVVTPAGVFVVDSKDWSGRISDGKDTIWVGRYPRTRELDTLEWETSKVTAVLDSALPGHRIAVRAVISLTNTAPARPVLTARGITAVAVVLLAAHLGSRPAVLQPAQVETIARVLDGHLPSRSGASSSLVRPDPLPAMPPVPPPGRPSAAPRSPGPWSSLARARPAVQRHGTFPAVLGARSSRRRSPTSRDRMVSRSSLGKWGAAVAGGFVCLVILGMIGSAIKHPQSPTASAPVPTVALPAPGTSTAGSGSAPPVAPAAVAPAGLHVTWSCPSPGRGWTAILAWPSGEAPSSFTIAQTAPSPTGPWTQVTSSRGPTPVQVTGIAGGTAEWIRAGELTALQLTGKPIMEGQVTAAPGC